MPLTSFDLSQIPEYRPGELIVKFRPYVLPESVPDDVSPLVALRRFLVELTAIDSVVPLHAIRPLVREGSFWLDEVLPPTALAMFGDLAISDRLRAVIRTGIAISFPVESPGGPLAETIVAPDAYRREPPARIRYMMSRWLLQFRDPVSFEQLKQIAARLAAVDGALDYVEQVPFRFIQPLESSLDPVAEEPAVGGDPEPKPASTTTTAVLPDIGTNSGAQASLRLANPNGSRPKSAYAGWGYDIINMDATTPSPVTPKRIAILDTGVDVSHPRLDGKVIPGLITPTNNGFKPYNIDYQGHGTHVCGTLIADEHTITDGYHKGRVIKGVLSGRGYSVISYKVVSNVLYLGKFYPVDPILYHTALDEVIQQIGQGNLAAVNMSIGRIAPISVAEDEDFDQLKSTGTPIVIAAGNFGSSLLYPAAYARPNNGIYAVGAAQYKAADTRLSARVWKYSNPSQNGYLSCVAPGANIFSTTPTTVLGNMNFITGQAWMSGTSMAAPHVTGLLAAFGRYEPFLYRSADHRFWGEGFATKP